MLMISNKIRTQAGATNWESNGKLQKLVRLPHQSDDFSKGKPQYHFDSIRLYSILRIMFSSGRQTGAG